MQAMNLPEPISALSSEHSALREKLDNLVRCCRARRRSDTDELTETVSEFVELLSAHVTKEETLLFGPARAALGDHACALEILEAEHETVADLKTELVRLIDDDPADRGVRYRRVLAKLTDQLADVLPAHIFKEDNILYPLLSQIISEADLQEMARDVESGSGDCLSTPRAL